MNAPAEQEESGLATLPVADIPGIDHATNTSMWKRDPRSPLIKSGPPGSCDTAMASDPKVFYDSAQEVASLSRCARLSVLSAFICHLAPPVFGFVQVWVMFYFGLGDCTDGHADILIAFSKDLIHWDKDDIPLYRAGGHPDGIDAQHAHKISIIYDDKGVGYLYLLWNTSREIPLTQYRSSAPSFASSRAAAARSPVAMLCTLVGTTPRLVRRVAVSHCSRRSRSPSKFAPCVLHKSIVRAPIHACCNSPERGRTVNLSLGATSCRLADSSRHPTIDLVPGGTRPTCGYCTRSSSILAVARGPLA